MLGLKKSPKNNEIHLQLKPKQRFFDQSLRLAFMIALALHLGAALLFHVRLFSNRQIETILPPTNTLAHFIKSSADENEAIVTSRIDTEGRLTAAQLIPPASNPELLSFESPKLIKELQFKQFDLLYNPFIEIEREVEENYFTHLDLPLFTSPVKIAVSGPLAEIPIAPLDKQFHDLFELQQYSPHQYSQKRAIYTVKVDTNSGQIFWYQLKENAIEQSQTALAEKLLKNFHFLFSTQEVIVNGEIEIIFTDPSRKLT